VHMAEPHLAALQIVFTPENWSGEVEFQSALDGRVINDGVARYRGLNSKHLEPVESRAVDEETVYLKVRTNQSELRIAQAARTRVCSNGDSLDIERKIVEEPGYIAHHSSWKAQKGMDLYVEKVIAIFTSRDHASAGCGIEAR
jgi:alpha,alpha-trehalase